MANNDMVKILIVLAAVWLIFGSGAKTPAPDTNTGDAGTGTGTNTGIPADTQCAFQPTLALNGVDKYTSTKTSFSNTYKKDGEAIATYTAAFNLQKGDQVAVLYGSGNSTTYDPILKNVVKSNCGATVDTFNGLVAATNYSIVCFNEEGNPIDDSSENETIGTGEAPTLRCEIRGASKAGHPMGGVLTAEIPASVFKESEIAVTGLGSIPKSSITGFYGDPVAQALSAYTLSAADHRVRAFEVEPIEGAVVKSFYVNLPAEDAQNPADTDDIILTFWPVVCYNEEDVTAGGEFRCGISDMDNTFQGAGWGYETIQID